MKNALCATVLCVLTGCVHVPPVPDMSSGVTLAPSSPSSATVPFLMDDDRVFVEVTFIRPDGAERRALAFVNQGQGGLTLSNALFRELNPQAGKPLHMKFGAMEIAVDGASVLPETLSNSITISLTPWGGPPTPKEAAQTPGGFIADFATPLPVEAVIPPGLMQHFQVVLDYGARTITLAAPRILKPEGLAVPIRVNPKTGFAMIDLTLADTHRVFVIDDGGSYSAAHGAWLRDQPSWLRGTGGIGEANLTMTAADADVPVLKIGHAAAGAVPLDDFGLLDMGGQGMIGSFVAYLFWDRIYGPKAGEPVDGWIGGSALKRFRVMIDYPNRMSYWLQQAPPDVHDLDQVGLTLARIKGVTTIVGIARKNGADTVSGVTVGDKLLRIDGRDAAPMTRGELLVALHGLVGETRRLTLERDGALFEIDAPVTAF